LLGQEIEYSNEKMEGKQQRRIWSNHGALTGQKRKGSHSFYFLDFYTLRICRPGFSYLEKVFKKSAMIAEQKRIIEASLVEKIYLF